ncbi:MAG: flagellar export protein FliJ [Planctomycetota bacterium]
MARFRFSLEKVHRLRKSELEQVKIEFQAAADAVQRIEDEITEFLGELEETRSALRKEQEKPRIHVRKLLMLEAGVSHLGRAIQKAKERRSQAVLRVESVRIRLQEAEQKSESLKRIKARNKGRFDTAAKADEMKRLDEIAVTRFVRSRLK